MTRVNQLLEFRTFKSEGIAEMWRSKSVIQSGPVRNICAFDERILTRHFLMRNSLLEREGAKSLGCL